MTADERPGKYVHRRKGAWPRPLPLSMPLMLRAAYRPTMGGSARARRAGKRRPQA